MEDIQKDVLADFISTPHLVQAAWWKRLLNFLIDYMSFIVLFVLIAFIIEMIRPGSFEIFSDNENDKDLSLGQRIIIFFVYAMFISAMEVITKGRSLGKLITGTRAVNHDGSNIGIGTAFKRGLARMVPLEQLTAIGSPSYPWHDKWPRTYVIDIKKSSVLESLT